MANTLSVGGNVINITFDSTNDIDFKTYFPYGVRLNGIQFIGATATPDFFVLKLGSDAGKIFCKMPGNSFISWAQPQDAQDLFLDYSAGTYGTPANCLAILYLS